MESRFIPLLLILLPFALAAQSPKQKLKQLQRENDSLRLALINCQSDQFQRITESMESPKFGENPVYSREELRAKLLPEIQRKSEEKHRTALNTIALTDQFLKYCDGIRDTLIMRSGGLDPNTGQPTAPRNKQVATQFFVEQRHGVKLQEAIVSLRIEYLKAIQQDPIFTPRIVLMLDTVPSNSTAKSWEEYKFKQMPLAAVFPIIGKYQADAKASEAAVLQFLKQ